MAEGNNIGNTEKKKLKAVNVGYLVKISELKTAELMWERKCTGMNI